VRGLNLRSMRVAALLSLAALLWGPVGGCCCQQDPCLANKTIEDATVEQAKALIDDYANDATLVILDVRTADEVAQNGRIAGSTNLDYNSGELTAALDTLDRDKMYLVYCAGGVRSDAAVAEMADACFQTVYDMLGGFAAWEDANYPVVN